MDDTALDLIETTASVRDVALPPAPPVAASTATGPVPSVLPRRHASDWVARCRELVAESEAWEPRDAAEVRRRKWMLWKARYRTYAFGIAGALAGTALGWAVGSFLVHAILGATR